MFSVDTPKGINSFTKEQLLNSIDDSNAKALGYLPKAVRYNLMSALTSVLGLTLNNDLAYFMLSVNPVDLCVAVAGSGKTTAAQLRIILDKIQQPGLNFQEVPRVLYLNYNRHNVLPCLLTHEQLVRKINAGIKGVNLDPALYSNTLHAFTMSWCNEYKAETGMNIQKQVTDAEALTLMYKICDIKGQELGLPRAPSPSVLLDLDNYRRECMLSYSEVLNTSKFAASGLSKETVSAILDKYNAMKNMKQQYDYVDYFIKYIRLLETNTEAREWVHRHYKMIVADEIQDFTPLMYKALKLSVGPNTKLICIGDDDQTLYSFKGADIKAMLNFKEMFENAAVSTLSTNLRCPSNVVTFSKIIVQRNVLRFDKEVNSVKPSGDIVFIPCSSGDEQVSKLIRSLKSMTDSELSDTVIAYRERTSSFTVLNALEKAGIPYHIIKGFDMYSHELFEHLCGIIRALRAYRVTSMHAPLYKVLPISKDDWMVKSLGYNKAAKKYSSVVKHFTEHNVAQFIQRSGFVTTLRELKEISEKICNGLPLREYMPQLIALFDKYFWKFQMKNATTPAFEEKASKIIYNEFMTDKTFEEFETYLENKSAKIKMDHKMNRGVALSTFHSLKGLGFSTVHLIDLEDSMFPGYENIDSLLCTAEQKRELKEEEVRLFYVACTRTKKSLNLWYSKQNPSVFIKEYLEGQRIKVETPSPMVEGVGLSITNKDLNVLESPASRLGGSTNGIGAPMEPPMSGTRSVRDFVSKMVNNGGNK